jgi:hypothetical protein
VPLSISPNVPSEPLRSFFALKVDIVRPERLDVIPRPFLVIHLQSSNHGTAHHLGMSRIESAIPADRMKVDALLRGVLEEEDDEEEQGEDDEGEDEAEGEGYSG